MKKECSFSVSPGDISNLHAAVELELKRSSPLLLFSLPIEKRFEEDTLPGRLLQWRVVGSIGAILYGWFLVCDLQLLPEVATLAICVRTAVLFLGLLTSNVLVRLSIPVWARESIVAFLCLCALGGVVFLFAVSQTSDKGVCVTGMLLVVTFNSVCLPNRFYILVPTIFLSAMMIALGILMNPSSAGVQFWQINIACSLMVLTLVTNYRIEKQIRHAYLTGLRETLRNTELTLKNDRLQTLSEIDSLTGILNRGAIDRGLMMAIVACEVSGQNLGVLMLDVDFFKAYNDRYGHQEGDDCLRRLAAVFRTQLRCRDLLGRFGGEEFLIVLPGLDLADCYLIGDRVRQAVEQAKIPHEGRSDKLRHVTVSIGLSAFSPGATQSMGDLISVADKELYAAKRSGRNRILPHISVTEKQGGLKVEGSLGAQQADRTNKKEIMRDDAA